MDPNNNNNKRESVTIGSWIMTAIFLSAFFPVGLIMLLVNLSKLGVFNSLKRFIDSGRAADTFDAVKDEVRTRAQRAAAEAAEKAEAARQRAEAKKAREDAAKRSAVFNSALKRSSRTRRLLRIFGGVAIFFGVVFGIDALDSLMYGWFDAEVLIELSFGLAGVVGGGVMELLASLRAKSEKLYKRYHAIIGANRSADIGRVSGMIPCSYRDAVRDLQNMIDDGYFESGAYIDHSRGLIFTVPGVEDADYVSGAGKQAESTHEKAAPADGSSTKNEYAQILREIRELNDRIADEDVSAKIDKIEYITGAIFSVVERRPEKLGQIKSFMSYYLPTTLKLLDSYAQFEAQGIEGENLSAAKKSIEGIMDNLVAGFEKQLDSLFQDDAMDVSSDIEVLETMMKRDGYDGSSFASDFFGGAAAAAKAEDEEL